MFFLFSILRERRRRFLEEKRIEFDQALVFWEGRDTRKHLFFLFSFSTGETATTVAFLLIQRGRHFETFSRVIVVLPPLLLSFSSSFFVLLFLLRFLCELPSSSVELHLSLRLLHFLFLLSLYLSLRLHHHGSRVK